MKKRKDKDKATEIQNLEKKVKFYDKFFYFIFIAAFIFVASVSLGASELLPVGDPASLERRMNMLVSVGALVTSATATGIPIYIYYKKVQNSEDKLKQLKLQEKSKKLTEPEKELVKQISKDKRIMECIKELNVSQIPQEKINLIKDSYQNDNIIDFITEVQSSDSYNFLKNYDIDNNEFIEEKPKTKKKSIFK